MSCELCKRDLELTEHHLIPKEMHNKKWCQRMFTSTERKERKANLCADCHAAIHMFISNKDLAKYYNTVDLLKENEKVAIFIKWVSKDNNRKFKF